MNRIVRYFRVFLVALLMVGFSACGGSGGGGGAGIMITQGAPPDASNTPL